MFIRYTSASGVESYVTTDGDADRACVAMRYIVDAHPEEPLFCLRARDLLTVPTIGAYKQALLVVQQHQPELISGPVLEAVEADFRAAVKWQGANGKFLKYPDRPAKIN